MAATHLGGSLALTGVGLALAHLILARA
jgi:hypothetical protein